MCIRQTGKPGGRRRIQRAIATQRTHVIDQPGTQPRGFAHDGWRGGIDRDDHIQLAIDALDDGRYALELLQWRNRPGTWPGRFATDIDQRRAGRHHGFGVAHGRVELAVLATIGERNQE